MSPSKTERKPNEKVKTDKKDAQNIAKLFRNGDITEVRVPPALDEAVRDVCRARTDASDDLRRSKQRLNAFLLRNGHRYSGKSRWTPSHMRYLRTLTLPDLVQKIVLEEYMQAIDSGIDRLQRLKDKMNQILLDWEWEPIVRALMACKGFQEVAAMTVISELGDLRRFEHPRELMGFLGLVPSEGTTGTRRRQGGITKCGNSHARWMLVECSQHYRKAPMISTGITLFHKLQEVDHNPPKLRRARLGPLMPLRAACGCLSHYVRFSLGSPDHGQLPSKEIRIKQPHQNHKKNKPTFKTVELRRGARTGARPALGDVMSLSCLDR